MERAPEYLLVLYVAEERRSPPIPPGYVAAALDRSPSATTEMFQRLAARDLVDHRPYEGATLTEEGRDLAADLYDRYVALARFFRDVLGLEDYQREAMEVAGAVSGTVTERLAATLLADEDVDESIEDALRPRRADSA